MDVARLLVEIDANTAPAETRIARFNAGLSAAALGFGMLGIAAVAAGVIAVKMAGDYQAGLTTLVTGAGESVSNINKYVREGVKQMAIDTGTSTKELISGLYMINSAGYRGKEGLDVLKVAAQGARSENADLGTVADALTTVMRDYPHVMNGAAGAMNTLIGTVENGKTHLQDLSQSLAMVLPTASAAGIGLNDVMGAMATLTGEGVPAANAATYLRQTFINLMAPGHGATKMLEEIGLTATQVSDGIQRNLPATFQLIEEHMAAKFPRSAALMAAEMVKVNKGTESMDQALQHVAEQGGAKYIEAIKSIAGGSKTMQGLLDLTGVHLNDFVTNVGLVSKAVKEGGNQVRGWDEVQKNFNFQMSKAKEMLEVAFISLGDHLLPKLTQVVKFMVDNAVPAVKSLTQFWKDHQGMIIVVAAVIAGALATAFIVWAVTAGAAAVATLIAIAPILLAGAAIGLLIAALIWGYQNIGFFHTAVDAIRKGFQNLGPEIKMVIGWFDNFVDVIRRLLGLLGNLKDAAGSALHSVGNAISGIHIPGFASGTSFTPGGAFMGAEQGPELLLTPGIYTAPRGSTILSARDTAAVLGASTSGGSSTTYNIYPAKSQFDAAEMDRLQRRRALLGSRGGGYS